MYKKVSYKIEDENEENQRGGETDAEEGKQGENREYVKKVKGRNKLIQKRRRKKPEGLSGRNVAREAKGRRATKLFWSTSSQSVPQSKVPLKPIPADKTFFGPLPSAPTHSASWPRRGGPGQSRRRERRGAGASRKRRRSPPAPLRSLSSPRHAPHRAAPRAAGQARPVSATYDAMQTVARSAMLLTLLALLARLHAQKADRHPANLYSVCSVYSSAVFRYEKDRRNPALVRKCDQCVMKKVPFIIGGSNASVHEFPHMALLGYGNKVQGAPKWVRLGELDLTTAEESQHEDFGVAESIPHPDYKDGIHYNDIALLRLDRKVIFTAAIRPACIHTLPEIADPLGIASGWGLIHWADPDNSEFLMKLNLHLYKTDICSYAYKTAATTFRLRNGIVEESMVCAGSPEGGKDTCRGDSGGPLQVKLSNPYCMYSVIGITSFGKGACGTTLSPSVYTRVSYFVPWLEDIVWPDDVTPEVRRQF
ncbi:Serine protease snake [Gryllus bimaculatus]|nr:Serine protease snake [Gryllus bimaculatus]